MNRRYFPLLVGLLLLTALLAGGCASTGGKKQASRRELIATLRSLEPLQSEGRIPRATVLAAFDLYGAPYSRGNGEEIGGQYLRLENWVLPSGMGLTGLEHYPKTRKRAWLVQVFGDSIITGKTNPGWLEAEVKAEQRVPEFYDTIWLYDRKRRNVGSLHLDFRKYRPSVYKENDD